MGLLGKLRHHPPTLTSGAAATATAPCPHAAFEPRWENEADSGQTEKATGYVCQSCGQAFTVEEARALQWPEVEPEASTAEEPAPAYARGYPRSIALANGQPITLRLMTGADADDMLRFARGLPADDLLFLRDDITDEATVARWVADIDAGRTVTVLAEEELTGELAGYASLHCSEIAWQRHLGEIRIQAGLRFRSQRLGRQLAAEAFSIARALGLHRLMAQMVRDQLQAATVFERLGFKREAVLHGFVVDRAGQTRDLLIMALDVEESGDAGTGPA